MSDNRQASHPCAACGGSGPHEYGKGTRLSSAYTIGRDGKDCPSYIERGSLAYAAWKQGRAVRACPVCLGAGTISDRMPAQDAVADAETLRRATQFNRQTSPLWETWNDLNQWGAHTVKAWVRHSVGAAFRVCPGLKAND